MGRRWCLTLFCLNPCPGKLPKRKAGRDLFVLFTLARNPDFTFRYTTTLWAIEPRNAGHLSFELSQFTMSSREEMTLPATRPKSRKSLAHIPSSVVDQENMTADLGALAGGKKAIPIEKPSKKSRSKSIGPGGLDALKDTTGNRRKVWYYRSLRLLTNAIQVLGNSCPSSSKINLETYDASSARDSGAYIDQKRKPEENYPTNTSVA